MATQAYPAGAVVDREHHFFFVTACIMACILVAGFSTNIVMARSSFAVPLIYHVHAVIFFGWIALYLLQTGLAGTGSLRLHRRLGWLALVWVPAMVVLATGLTVTALRRTGGPFFFDKNEFLFGNFIGILTFAGLALWAIIWRRRTDWHRRLMLCAMASIMGPGFGRLLPMPLLIPWAWWMVAVICPSFFLIAGMIADRRWMRRVHPAYLWGLGLLVGVQILTDMIAYSPAGLAMTQALSAGTPGAARPMRGQFLPAS